MKLKITFIFIIVCVGLLALGLFAKPVMADDVYNFYFQKAPGPVTVNQGGATSSAAATTPNSTVNQSAAIVNPTPGAQGVPGASPAPLSAAPVPASESPQVASHLETPKPSPENEFRHWQLSLGKSSWGVSPTELQMNGSNGSVMGGTNGSPGIPSTGQWSVGVEYKFGRGFAVELQGSQTENAPIRFDYGSNFNWTAGIVYTPFHINLFNISNLDLGVIAGYGSVPVPLAWTDSYGNINYYPYFSQLEDYYAGAKATLDLGKGISAIGAVKFAPTLGTMQTTVAVGFDL